MFKINQPALTRLLASILSMIVAMKSQTEAVAQPAAQSSIDAISIEALVTPYLGAKVLGGVSIGVVKGDDSWTGNYGSLTPESEAVADADTVYEIGSVSKVFTGILLADAVKSGQLTLTDSVGSVFPELRLTNPELAKSITLKHLATHTSGLPRMPSNFNPKDPRNPYVDYDRGAMLEFLGELKPNRKPGEKAEYSNLAVAFLGELLAMKADRDYATLVKEVITDPLEMPDTYVQRDQPPSRALAPPHNANLDPDRNWGFSAMAGAGAICSTTNDMVRFIKANLDPPDSRLGRAIDLAWKQHLPAEGGAFAMGLGWHIARDGDTRWHNGQTGGYHSMLLINRQLNVGVVVLSNTASGAVDELAESIIRRVMGNEVKPKSFPAAVQVDPEWLARLTGDYQLVPGFVLTVRADGNQLLVQATGQPELRVFPKSKTEWFYKVVDAQITFELGEEGPSPVLTLHQNGRDMKAKRLETNRERE